MDGCRRARDTLLLHNGSVQQVPSPRVQSGLRGFAGGARLSHMGSRAASLPRPVAVGPRASDRGSALPGGAASWRPQLFAATRAPIDGGRTDGQVMPGGRGRAKTGPGAPLGWGARARGASARAQPGLPLEPLWGGPKTGESGARRGGGVPLRRRVGGPSSGRGGPALSALWLLRSAWGALPVLEASVNPARAWLQVAVDHSWGLFLGLASLDRDTGAPFHLRRPALVQVPGLRPGTYLPSAPQVHPTAVVSDVVVPALSELPCRESPAQKARPGLTVHRKGLRPYSHGHR
eukprot:scaffold1363_cov356-Prasinococcus_capsulatus_cf.AAC.6